MQMGISQDAGPVAGSQQANDDRDWCDNAGVTAWDRLVPSSLSVRVSISSVHSITWPPGRSEQLISAVKNRVS